MRVVLIGSGYAVRNGAAFSYLIVECDCATECSNRLAPRPSCRCMRSPTLNYASKLPSVYPSQTCCVAGEQFFADSFILRPSSRCKVAYAEIAVMETILIYEPAVRASARGTVHTIPGVDSQLLTPPARPQGERCTPTLLPLHDSDAWP